MKEFRILFTGIGRRVELVQAFREAALALDKRLKIYGADMALDAPALLYCDYTERVCGMCESGYIEMLIDICVKNRINLLIPTIDTDLLILSENRDKFQAVGTRVLISDPNMIRICRDKNNTSQFFVDCGLKAPMPVNDWKKYHSDFPAFIKPKDGSSSVNAFKAENTEELKTYAGRIEDYIVQPFVEGTEYTIDICCDFDGNPIWIVPRERVAVRAGEVLKTRICMDLVMINEAKALIEKFKPCGPITVQLIREKESGQDYFIEINPRFGGGAPLSMKAGARSAESILKLLSGEKAVYSEDIANHAVYSRFDQSVCISQGKNGRIKGVIFDLDDTLYSEKEYVKSGYHAVAEYLGDGEYAERLWEFFEDGKPAIDELLKKIGRASEKERCLSIYRGHFPLLHLYEGAIEILAALKSKGVKLGMITDGRPEGQRAKIEALRLDKVFDDIVITDELGGVQFRKPCDIAFRILQTRWRLHPGEIVYIGDNYAKDFQAPKGLGMKSIYFQNMDGLYPPHREKESQCWMQFDSMKDIGEQILHLC